MADTSARMLRLLSALQTRRHWTGDDLAAWLEVTPRTVRRDVDRLRMLGYPVEATPGRAGGYQLGAGGDVPPLLLDDDEAIAIVVALSTAAGNLTGGIEHAAIAALAKLDRLLPARLRTRVRALRDVTTAMTSTAEPVDPDVLVTIAQASESHERITISYRDRDGAHTERRCEPYRLVSTGRRWYAVVHDVDRQDWRTLRVDRIEHAVATGHRFVPRELPDPAAMVANAISTAPYRYQAVVAFDAAAGEVRRRVPATVGVVRERRGGCVLTTGADDLDALAGHLIGIGLPFEVLEPAALRARMRDVGRQVAAAHKTPASSVQASRDGRRR